MFAILRNGLHRKVVNGTLLDNSVALLPPIGRAYVTPYSLNNSTANHRHLIHCIHRRLTERQLRPIHTEAFQQILPKTIRNGLFNLFDLQVPLLSLRWC